MGSENGDVAVGVASTEGATRGARHDLVVAEVAVPVGLAALDGMMHQITGDDRLAPFRADAEAHVAGGVPRRRLEDELVANPMIALHEVGATSLHHRPHTVGDDRPVLVAVARRPVLPFLPREEVSGAGE